ncbi:toll/interleukin-1 receptor domain-containing protein [Elongatibacter sediminis]|uniref:Toll/interleukin-1 receptor domain-containing protein n=1 Tax=Elongatibacter sediminis TaxID=3119006 RepID=A0AAW9RFS4_9GAMM
MTPPHYKAFISYSHQDESWARWLQKSLEGYRIPKRLVGAESPHGPVPKRLQPIFRDREDLSSASDLSTRIKQELAASETLIVVCSPAAARSRWVNEEIRYFRELGRGDRILALVVDGDPLASGTDNGCFPGALLDGGNGHAIEPLAADARKYADGRSLARLKLVAGILGIRLDELRRRDAQRRTRRRLFWGTAGMATVSLIGWLAWAMATSQEAARVQRANTEELLSFMLGDLKRLDPIVGLEIVDDHDLALQRYRTELDIDAKSNEELVAAASGWRDRGIDFHGRGELEPAMQQFQQSRAALVELHQREGGTQRALYELGQAEFWVGYVHMDRGELDQAQLSFSRYGAIARRLINADPNNAEMVMELAYTLANLGALERARQNPDTAQILQLFQSAVQYNQMALVLDAGNDTYRQDLVTMLAHLADAWLETCDLGNAFSLRMQNVELSRELHRGLPGDSGLQQELAYALSGLSSVQQQMGLLDLAEQNIRESGELLRDLLSRQPGNEYLRWELLLREQRLARLYAAQERLDEAWSLFGETAEGIEANRALSDSDNLPVAVEAAEFRLDLARLAFRMGEDRIGREALDRAVGELAVLVGGNPGHRHAVRQLAHASFAYWDLTGRLPGGQVTDLLDGYLSRPRQVQSCTDAGTAARLALLRGDLGLARDYTRYVLGKGYFEPGFVAFCGEYGLCDLRSGKATDADHQAHEQTQQPPEQ